MTRTETAQMIKSKIIQELHDCGAYEPAAVENVFHSEFSTSIERLDELDFAIDHAMDIVTDESLNVEDELDWQVIRSAVNGLFASEWDATIGEWVKIFEEEGP